MKPSTQHSTLITPHIDTTGIAAPTPKVDRHLPPPELNARRTRKRNQTHLAPPSATPPQITEKPARLSARPNRPGVHQPSPDTPLAPKEGAPIR
jgi:hypothetical protein